MSRYMISVFRVAVSRVAVSRVAVSLALPVSLALTLAHFAWPLAAGAQVAAPQDAEVSWLVGERCERQLAMPLGLTWKANPLHPALQNLARTQKVPILLDRRVDPGQPVDYSARQISLDTALDQLAERLGLTRVQIGPVIWLGPAAADRAATAALLRADEVTRLPRVAARRWQKEEAWQWPELASPRELLEQLAKQAQVELQGLNQVPHDLWPAADLPPMTVTDRMSLVLAGFDLSFQFDGTDRVQLQPIPGDLSLEKVYRVPRASRVVGQLRSAAPQAQIAVQGGQLTLRGSWRDHDQLARLLRPAAKTPSPAPGTVRYTLKVENKSVGSVAKALAGKLGVRLKIDPAIAARLQRNVSFSVQNVTLDELLGTFLRPAGVGFRVDQSTLHLHAAP